MPSRVSVKSLRSRPEIVGKVVVMEVPAVRPKNCSWAEVVGADGDIWEMESPAETSGAATVQETTAGVMKSMPPTSVIPELAALRVRT